MRGNLLPASLRQTAEASVVSRRVRAGVALSIAVIGAAAIAADMFTRGQRSDAGAALVSLDAQIADAEARRDALARQAEAMLAMERAAASTDWSLLVRTLAVLADGRITAEQMSISGDGDAGQPPTRIEITGLAADATGAVNYVLDLNQLPVFADATLRSAQRTQEGAVRVEIIASLAAPGGDAGPVVTGVTP